MAHSQRIQTVYLIHGQGFDYRLFESITLDPSYQIKYINYETPPAKISLKEFAIHLAKDIDTTENFALIGVSLGGMLTVEMTKFLNPQKAIIVSSAKNRYEFPFHYRFQKVIPIYAIIPAFLYNWGAKILQPLVEPDRNNNKETFKAMLNAKNGRYFKQTSRLILTWENTDTSNDVIHIHGNNDHTIPYRNINKPNYTIENGSHMMILTRAKEISKIINQLLTE